ncbi:MAG: putative DNA binding domain-containing protein [Eubacteriales bacterium]|nr:putative DNA binding domain-containing protein [Eubacteriales bacterium]
MDSKILNSILTIGETVAVEFKRCGNGIESDTYETVCSFLNRFGGDIFMGVLDDGTVVGVPEKAAADMVRNFITVISNPALFSPTIYLTPEIIKDEQGHTVIHVHIPPGAEVHSYKKVIYDRVDDADVKVTATGAIAQMYIRKQNIFTEKKIFPYAKMEDLRLDLLPKIRVMAQNHAGGQHPWTAMDDQELLKSAGLYGRDIATGEEGYNLAAIMLLGKDDVILNVAPVYVTDALVRKVNVDRYDDREIIRTNLIESYDRLLEFGRKHLLDKFFLEDTVNKSLRNTIVREMVSNTLMHREFTSSYTAKFVIEKERMYVENANRAWKEGYITVDNLEPNPKNPIIASFFRNIGYADQLGSGVRNLFKYSKYYSGQEPQFVEGDVFRIIVPLDDEYSFDFGSMKSENGIGDTNRLANETESADKMSTDATRSATDATKSATEHELTEDEKRILSVIKKNPRITQKKLHEATGISLGTIKRILPRLQAKGVLTRNGSRRSGQWKIQK